MRITIVAGTPLGDVQPYIALGLGLQEAGHSVQLAVIAHHEDFVRWLHVTGYWFLEPPSHWQPPEDLIHFLNAGSPPVYVTFASLNSWNCAVTFKLVCAALAKTGQRAIFQIVNSSDEDEFKINFPPEVFPLTQWVSYDWLLPQVSAIVHYAGYGRTAYAARVGIPSVTLPAGDDQFFWAKCITASGIGTPAILPNQVSIDRLAAAIQTATSDRQMQFRANALSKHIQTEHGVQQAIAAFHSHLNEQIGEKSFHAANTSVI